jgi:RNA polymerase sigma-70 factor (ECF subfamily)
MSINEQEIAAEKQSDAQLIMKVREGDENMFALLVQRYQPKLLGFFYRMSGSLEESEDLSQETFINVYFNLQKFDASKDFYPWLFTIAHHLAVNRYHRNNKIRLIDIEKIPEIEDKEDIFDAVIKRESKDIIHKILSSLRGEYRSVLELRYLKEQSYQEIAEFLQVPLNTVKSRLFRAKALVTKMFHKVAVH